MILLPSPPAHSSSPQRSGRWVSTIFDDFESRLEKKKVYTSVPGRERIFMRILQKRGVIKLNDSVMSTHASQSGARERKKKKVFKIAFRAIIDVFSAASVMRVQARNWDSKSWPRKVVINVIWNINRRAALIEAIYLHFPIQRWFFFLLSQPWQVRVYF